MQRIKKDDIVQVISGNENGNRGAVEDVIRGWYVDRRTRKRLGRKPDNDRVCVEGLNIRKKHKKKTAPNMAGEVVEISAPIHISNVMLVCPHCDEATRVGFKTVDAKKVRYCKRCDANID
jgi:large subunit ribosomal protein L24